MEGFFSRLLDNPLTTLLIIGFFAATGYALWLRFRMSVSKARFALAVVATMASSAAALLMFLSGPLSVDVANSAIAAANSLFGLHLQPIQPTANHWVSNLFAVAMTSFALWAIYSFSVVALSNWDGPITVNVNELAKREQDNSLLLLAVTEIRRILASKEDPLASDVAVNWQQRQSEAPAAPPWPMLARTLFEAAFAEIVFSDSSWRDRFHTWIGEMYLSQPKISDTVPVILFVFDDEPTNEVLEARTSAFKADGASIGGAKIFAIFAEGQPSAGRKLMVQGIEIEVWSRHSLLRKGLRLTAYARELIRRFDKDLLGGTAATLRETFVASHVIGQQSRSRVPLDDVLAEWLADKGRRHLAITGEYGQGKSTAMLEFCVKWAKRYLENPEETNNIPLLIELRGQNPAESDPLGFLSGWAGRYGIPPKQLYNLIKAGEAILIFEGFDELRNAGRAYDRHEHFNALWRLGYPGTKMIFTGRPNFFLDEREKNRTLRADALRGLQGMRIRNYGSWTG